MSESGYVVHHRHLGAFCGLTKGGFHWQGKSPYRTPVVFHALGSAQACVRALIGTGHWLSEEFEVREYARKGT